MATRLGSHARRLSSMRALRTTKGRREQQRFAFEGTTLLAEAVSARFPIDELYVTSTAYETSPIVRDLEAAGTPTFLLADSTLVSISELSTPSGIVGTARMRLQSAQAVFHTGSPTLILADLNDPANAGTLLRSADAFGCRGVLFGPRGVDPYHPKVVRGSMGAIFRLALGIADPDEVAGTAASAGVRLVGLAAGGSPLAEEGFRAPVALLVGHERRGLGPWQSLCAAVVAIPMQGAAESLSAAVAGSIALYEATLGGACQESLFAPKSQDYRWQKSHGILRRR